MSQESMHDHRSPVWDWFLDNFALLVVAFATIAVFSVVLGSGMVMFGAFTWAEASEVVIYVALGFGAIFGLYWMFHCIKEACHNPWRSEQ